MKVSNCCGAPGYSNGDGSFEDYDLCSDCGEHCEYVAEEEEPQKIDSLLNKILDNNQALIDQLIKMNQDDQAFYSKRIAEIMERTSKTVSEIKSGAVNSAKNNI